MADEKKWVYKSVIGGSIVVKPSSIEPLRDAQGTVIQMKKTKPIKLHFTNGFLTVNDDMAKYYGVTAETLVKLIEEYNDFNKRYWLVQSPDFAASKKDVEAMKEAIEKPSEQNIKVKNGVRTR